MPNISASLISALTGAATAANTNVAPAANAAGQEKDNFQSLLDIGINTPDDNAGNDRAVVEKDRRREENNVQAAPVNIPAERLIPDKKPQADNEDKEDGIPAAVRPFQNSGQHAGKPKANAKPDNAREDISDDVRPAASSATDVTADVEAAAAGAASTVADNGNISTTAAGAQTLAIDLEQILTQITVNLAVPGGDDLPGQIQTAASVATAPELPVALLTLNQPQFLPDPISGADDILVVLPSQPTAIGPALPVPPAIPSFDGLLKNVWQTLQNINDSFFGADDGKPLSTMPPLAAMPQGPLLRLKSDLKAAFALFDQYNAGTIDAATLLNQIKPMLNDMHRIMARLDTKPDAMAGLSLNPLGAGDLQSAAPVIAPKKETSVANIPNMDAAIAAQNLNSALTTKAEQGALFASTIAMENALGNNVGNRSGADANANQNLPQPVLAMRAADPAREMAATDATGFARALGAAARGPIVDQVVFHIRVARSDGSSRIHIQLEPETLGKLDIKLHVDAEGKTGVTITADNKNTLDLLQRDTKGLERALADAGLTADSGNLNFNLRGEQQGQDNSPYPAFNYQKAIPEEEKIPAADTVSGSYVIQTGDGVDITI